jgi:flagellum-specific peptidoglycan hydrolase FlgJ
MLIYETSEIFRNMAVSAARLEKAEGFPPAVLLAQWALESGWGARVTGDFNYWGKIRAPETGSAKFCSTHEDVTLEQLTHFRADELASETHREPIAGGQWRVQLSRWFASYASLDESLADYVATFIHSPHRYQAAWQGYQQTKDVDAFFEAICKAGYATGVGYDKQALAIEHQQNIQHAVTMARTAL